MASLSNAEITNKSVHNSDNPVRKSAIVDTSKLKVLQEQSAEEVGEWLDDQGFGAYSQNFVDNNVNGECVPLLSKQDLLDIGVTKVGDRLRMLRHMREYKVALEVQQRTKVLLRWLEFRWFCLESRSGCSRSAPGTPTMDDIPWDHRPALSTRPWGTPRFAEWRDMFSVRAGSQGDPRDRGPIQHYASVTGEDAEKIGVPISSIFSG